MRHLLTAIMAICILHLASCSKEDETSGSSSKKEESKEQIDNSQDRKKDSITGDEYEYQLPVIFHVLYTESKNSEQYVPVARLKQILDNVNKIYSGSLGFSSWNNMAAKLEYDGNTNNIHVKFVLAEKDEDGNTLATPGVEYKKFDGTLPLDCEKFMNDNKRTYTKYIWDPNNYINVMVYPFEANDNGSITLGISIMPYQANGYPQIEGLTSTKYTQISKTDLPYAYCLCINSLYMNNKYSDGSYEQCNFFNKDYDGRSISISTSDPNVTLAHELGHYLGLFHDFSEPNDDSSTDNTDTDTDTDYCKDTKSYNRTQYNKWLEQYINDQNRKGEKFSLDTCLYRSNSRGEAWESINVMDYSVTMGYYISDEQRNRIRQVLYYSPLIPGPKKARTQTRTVLPEEDLINLPRVIMKKVLRAKQNI